MSAGWNWPVPKKIFTTYKHLSFNRFQIEKKNTLGDLCSRAGYDYSIYSVLKTVRYQICSSVQNYTRGQYCTRAHNCTKILLYVDTFAQGDKIAQRHFCTKIVLHEQTIINGHIFARVELFFYIFPSTITVTTNPYPWSITFFILFN